MLQKIEGYMKRLLDLADYVEKADDFDQSNWHTCICGQAAKMLGAYPHAYGPNSGCNHDWGATALGLTHRQSCDLFSNFNYPSRERAARVIRHLALTGEVDWNRGRNWRDWFRRSGNDQAGGEVLSRDEPVLVSNA